MIGKTENEVHLCLLKIDFYASFSLDVSLLHMAPKKLATKRARKTTAGEGSSTSPPADFVFYGHKFCSEEHQCCFGLIKDRSFLKKRRV